MALSTSPGSAQIIAKSGRDRLHRDRVGQEVELSSDPGRKVGHTARVVGTACKFDARFP